MLTIRREHSQEVIAHAMEEAERSDGPRECVGLIVCHVTTRQCRVIRLTNSHPDPANHFEVREREIRGVYRQLMREREYIDVIYHSHLRVAAVPSQGDVDNADLEDAHYLIVATSGRGRALRSWRIQAGEAREEPVHIEA
jgi:proteasome lid subunit RPN8/RPN11